MAIKQTTNKKRKIRKSVHFHLPKTLKLPRNPKYPRKAIPPRNKFGEFSLFKAFLTSEKAMSEIENRNTLVMLFDRKATKPQIRKTILKIKDVKIQKINTMLDMNGNKKAYVRLCPEEDALVVSEQFGFL